MNFIRNHKYFVSFFTLVFTCNILFLHVLTEYVIVAKPLIMCSLLGYYITHASPQSKSFLLALIAALFGDIFLLMPGDDFFLLGLGCFLIMQLLYTKVFFKQRTLFRQKIWIPIYCILILAVSFLFLTWPVLDQMKIPVTLYALAISAMCIAAWLRSPSPGFSFVAWGAVFFMVSDLTLAVNRFYALLPYAGEIVMATYMIAQFLIITGLCATNESDPEVSRA